MNQLPGFAQLQTLLNINPATMKPHIIDNETLHPDNLLRIVTLYFQNF